MAKKESQVEKPVRKPIKRQEGIRYALCVPSSIISSRNAKNLQQITSIAYEVARAATLYNVAEVVILKIQPPEMAEQILEEKNAQSIETQSEMGGKKIMFNLPGEDKADKPDANDEQKVDSSNINENNAMLFATLLQFFVTPPYLVKSVFAGNLYGTKFKYAQSLPKLSTLPFMCNNHVHKSFREGLTIPKKSPKVSKKKKKHSRSQKLSVTNYVNIGSSEALKLDAQVPVNVRVTVDLRNKKIVSPVHAYGVAGSRLAFGYHVRVCNSFSALFTESSLPDGYTSSIYISCDDYFDSSSSSLRSKLLKYSPPANIGDSATVLLVLANLNDLVRSCLSDQENLAGVSDPCQMFDSELAIPKGARIEDAALIALATLSRGQ